MAGPSLLLFAYRKPGTTPEHFYNYYENVHMKLIKELAGDTFPLSHTRRYVHRTEAAVAAATPDAEAKASTSGTVRNAGYPATVFRGEQADFEYDCCVEIVFEDQAAVQAFTARMAEPERAARLAADEENFLDRSK
jgi:hypothetical protein